MNVLNNKIKKQEISLELPNNSLIAVLVGHNSINLVKLEKLIDVEINLFGNQFNISGSAENIKKAKLDKRLKNLFIIIFSGILLDHLQANLRKTKTKIKIPKELCINIE